MHRLQHDKPDWADVPADARNSWQRIAVATHGYGTLGNAITLSGLALSLVGVGNIRDGKLVVGVCLLGIGRVADILDGYVAEHTKTKSRIGEALDATSDKIMALVTVAVFAVGHIIPLGPLLFVFLHSVTNTVFSATARLRGRELHPSDAGKYATILEWVVLLWFLIARILMKHHVFAAGVCSVLGYLLLVITIAPAVIASIGYGRQALSPREPSQ
jgi:phosphatidylglycerophosphate synthase